MRCSKCGAEIADENMFGSCDCLADPPAGWVPRQFIEFITEPITDASVLQGTFKVIREGSDEFQEPNAEDLKKVRRVIGRRDIRNGAVDMQQHSQTPFMVVDVDFME